MATIKISELEEVTELSTSDVLPIINENETKKVSLEKLNEILGGNNDVNLSNYYTKEETNSAISTNLSNYSTTTQINEALAEKQPLLTAGENITIINNVISASGGGNTGESVSGVDYIYEIDTGVKAFDFWDSTASIDTANIKNVIGEIITDIRAKLLENNNFAPILKLNLLHDHRTSGTLALQSYILMGLTKYNGYGQFDAEKKASTIYFSCRTINQMFGSPRANTQILMTVGGAWNGTETFTPSYIRMEKQDAEFLSKTNTDEYTPTEDYHPATKKYVDDAITSAITSVMEAEY